MSAYADVVLDISGRSLDRTFQYRIPAGLSGVAPGIPVIVPFGSGGRKVRGYVVGLSDKPKLDEEKIKDIVSVSKEAVPIEASLIALAFWIQKHYGSTMNQAVRTVLPVRKKEAPKEKKTVEFILDEETAKAELSAIVSKKRHSVAKERFMKALIEDNVIPWDVCVHRLDIPSSVIRDFEKRCFVRIISSRDYRNPVQGKSLEKPEKKITLNSMQQTAVDVFRRDWEDGLRKTYLLYGVTGSGKTEVYLSMIERVLESGKQAIVLIPEIALTYQTLMRFYARFGDAVSVIHSRLSPGERSDQFERAKNGDIKIMIGPRSALFTPFPALGIIIIDEEQETSYKSETVPKYHARETAEARAEIEGASLVLGSATPSLESFSRAKDNKYELLSLEKRAAGNALAEPVIVDMRRELASGNRSILSGVLEKAIEERLRKNEQTMLFLNRRGLMGFVSCRSCGHVLKCPHCDVSLSLHRDGRLHCHYCGYETDNVKNCPQCGSKYIGTFRAGTEKVEEFIKSRFPEARILRMDADTTKGKSGHADILSAFSNREADILIGTQMIVKGHDFGNVTLMGILAADMSLNASDFRSGERTFDLITQAAGRAGRGEAPGEVVIQTYQPESYVIRTAAAQDYEAFYEEEASYRRLMKYPPFSHLLLVQVTGDDREKTARAAEALFSCVKAFDPEIFLMRPKDAALAKLNDIYRMAVYLKDDDEERLIAVKDRLCEEFPGNTLYRDVNVFFDFDPAGGY